MSMRYLFDENITKAYREQLLRHVPDLAIRFVGENDAPPYGTPDEDILRWCEEHDFLLITNNRNTMPAHLETHLASGRHMSGIFLFPHDSNLWQLLLIAGASEQGEYRDRITYLPL